MGRSIPETSRAAYEQLDPSKLSETKRQILYALSQLIIGTHEDISAYLKVERSVVWKRLNELEKESLIYKPGTKKALRSGRLGFNYCLSGKSMPKTRAQEKLLAGPSIVDYSRKINAIAKSVPATCSPGTLF